MTKKIVQIDHEKCISCGSCINICPNSALNFDDDNKIELNEPACDGLGGCVDICPVNAINYIEKDF